MTAGLVQGCGGIGIPVPPAEETAWRRGQGAGVMEAGGCSVCGLLVLSTALHGCPRLPSPQGN